MVTLWFSITVRKLRSMFASRIPHLNSGDRGPLRAMGARSIRAVSQLSSMLYGFDQPSCDIA